MILVYLINREVHVYPTGRPAESEFLSSTVVGHGLEDRRDLKRELEKVVDIAGPASSLVEVSECPVRIETTWDDWAGLPTCTRTYRGPAFTEVDQYRCRTLLVYEKKDRKGGSR